MLQSGLNDLLTSMLTRIAFSAGAAAWHTGVKGTGLLAAALGGLIYLVSAAVLFQPASFSGEVGQRLPDGIGWVNTHA